MNNIKKRSPLIHKTYLAFKSKSKRIPTIIFVFVRKIIVLVFIVIRLGNPTVLILFGTKRIVMVCF